MNILTNAQLEDIVRLMPQSVSDFRKISGIGEAKSKNHGEELLALLHQTPASEGVRGKEVKAVSATTHESISRTENTNTAGTENIQRNDDETGSCSGKILV